MRYADDFVVFCESREDAHDAIDDLERGGWPSAGSSSQGRRPASFTSPKASTSSASTSGTTLLRRRAGRGTSCSSNRARPRCDGFGPSFARNGDAFVGHPTMTYKDAQPHHSGPGELLPTRCGRETFRLSTTGCSSGSFVGRAEAHSTKPWGWRRSQYWGRLTQRRDQWVFGDKQTGAFLWKYSWFPIERHALVRGRSSKDDPMLADYWAARERAKATTLKPSARTVARAQNCLCDVCGESLLNGEDLNRIRPRGRSRKTTAASDPTLRHLSCQQIHRMRMERVVRDLLEPDAGKVACPVVCPERRYVEDLLDTPDLPCSARPKTVACST